MPVFDKLSTTLTRGITTLAVAGVALTVPGVAMASAAPVLPAFDDFKHQVAGCGGSGYAPPGGAWGPVSTGSCSHAGTPNNYSVTYSYQAVSDATPVHASALHFTNPSGVDPGAQRWSEFGFGKRGTSLPLAWGNALASPQIKFQGAGLGTIVNWYF
ncbi:hypothetical protein [Gordonia sp. NPDC127522]|uniref:hypothetical protein n=1 Tax=Gordonia sp. NPDC127522 TaxID=3345390 RepID=UPI00362C378D